MSETNEIQQTTSESSFTKKLKDDIHIAKESVEKDSSPKAIAILACVATSIWFVIWAGVFSRNLTMSIIACVVLPIVVALLIVAWIKVSKHKTLRFGILIRPFLLVGWIVAITSFVLTIVTSAGLSGSGNGSSWLNAFSTLLYIVGTAGFGLSVAATVLLFIAQSKGTQHE